MLKAFLSVWKNILSRHNYKLISKHITQTKLSQKLHANNIDKLLLDWTYISFSKFHLNIPVSVGGIEIPLHERMLQNNFSKEKNFFI